MKDLVTSLRRIGAGKAGTALPVKPDWLTGQLLIAMPGMPDPRFTRAVIYVCSHNAGGAMGLVITRLFGDADVAMLLDQLNIDYDGVAPDVPVQFGGPVEMGRGFILHSGEYLREGTTRVDEAVAVTATVEILKDVVNGRGPQRMMMALGYTGWGAGQLEDEMKGNGWLTAPADADILFDADLDSKWDRAMAKIGISPAMLSGSAGHA